MNTANRFPSSGLNYFWFLNDFCDDALIDGQIEEFRRAGIHTVSLHPRDGLLVPYGGSDWFSFIGKITRKLAAKGIGVWLYDEDPFPSGNAGGRIVLEHPEFIAKNIVMHKTEGREAVKDGLWCFPAKGKLLFCGLISEKSGKMLSDETGRVGIVRRHWTMMKKWDSRWYYPTAPLYVSDRAMADVPEYAIKTGKIPNGAMLAAFTVEAVHSSKWNFFVDPLNPHATEKFIEYTHEKYKEVLGDMFGREIKAIFTDEAKYYGDTPWTPGMFQDFRKTYGYALERRLHHLFFDTEVPEVISTKLDYREWCGKRFEKSWLAPVSVWCMKNRLKLVGHMSPEDDPVQQAGTLSNLMPLQKHLSMPGTDLIIPAVGDSRHKILNVGILSAVSAAQQNGKCGVLSELLACSGRGFKASELRRIMNWQTVMGMTVPVIHGIFHSLRGERRHECPPDFGPSSKYGEALKRLSGDLIPVQEMLADAVQIAPVAILWPIRTFHLLGKFWRSEDGGIRGELFELIHLCLESHVGIHLLDESDLGNTAIDGGVLKIGKARYSHVIVPGGKVWDARTWELLSRYSDRGLKVYQYGTAPSYLKTKRGTGKFSGRRFERLSLELIRKRLPRLLEISSADNRNIRVSGWRRKGVEFYLASYLGKAAVQARIYGHVHRISGQKITMIKHSLGQG